MSAPKPKVDMWSIRAMSPDTQVDTCPAMLVAAKNDEESHPLDAKFFIQAMMNRMAISYHKYGSIERKFPHGAVGIDQVFQRCQKYAETGNVEWLIDAANYCMIEALRPSHPKAHFRSTDSDESPGRLNIDGTVSHGR